MASPQIENGYIKIANELFEALIKIRIPGEARQVLDSILRNTYGFNKKSDAISLSQFCLSTGLKKNSVCRAINKLKQLNIIHQKGYSIANIYSINKDFTTWLSFTKKSTSPKSELGGHQKVNKGVTKKGTTKDSKDMYTKDTRPQGGEEQKLFDLFYKTINPTISFNNKTEWSAAKELVKKFGIEKILRTAEYAISIHGKQYAPTIATPYQLKIRLPELMAYYKKESIKQNNQTSKTLIL